MIDEESQFTNMYVKENDISDNNSEQDQDGKKQNELLNVIQDELAEPEIMNYCYKYPRAVSIAKECIKKFNEKNWVSLKSYLKDKIECKIDSVGENEETAIFFSKNFYLGICHFKLGECEEALSCFFEAVKVHQYHQLNYNIALCYIKLDNLENAVFYLEKVTKQMKNYFFAYYNLIRIYLKKNNINDAYLIYRDFSEVIKRDKDYQKHEIKGESRLSTATFNVLKLFYKLGAECCFAKSLYQECVLTILEALKFNPEDPELWCLYAKVFIMKKTFEFARPLLQKALDISPNYTEARELLDFLNEEGV